VIFWPLSSGFGFGVDVGFVLDLGSGLGVSFGSGLVTWEIMLS
jgi:hypothetical protein